jgi:hypothetical protein
MVARSSKERVNIPPQRVQKRLALDDNFRPYLLSANFNLTHYLQYRMTQFMTAEGHRIALRSIATALYDYFNAEG